MGTYLAVYIGIEVALFLVFLCVIAYSSWQLIAIAKLILCDPDMQREDKLASLAEVAPICFVWLGILGQFVVRILHWPDSAYIPILALMGLVMIWAVYDSRRPLAERVDRLRQRCARTEARTIARLRSEGIYPQEGQLATDEQIKSLAQTKYAIYAYSLYRETHQVDIKEAAAAVKRMKQELKTG